MLLKLQKILWGLCKDMIFAPVAVHLGQHNSKRKSPSAEKTSVASTKTRTSRMGDRFGRYLATWRYREGVEDDFWKRDDEKSSTLNGVGYGDGWRAETTALPSVLVSEARGGRTGTGH
jgi:hypothetical protein